MALKRDTVTEVMMMVLQILIFIIMIKVMVESNDEVGKVIMVGIFHFLM